MKTLGRLLVGVGVLMGSLGLTASAAQSSAPRPGTGSSANRPGVTTNRGIPSNHNYGRFDSRCAVCREMQRKGYVSNHGQYRNAECIYHRNNSNRQCFVCNHIRNHK